MQKNMHALLWSKTKGGSIVGPFNRYVLDESTGWHYSKSERGGGEAPTIPGGIGAVDKNLDPFK
jgi:hypothetical protein